MLERFIILQIYQYCSVGLETISNVKNSLGYSLNNFCGAL